jgi:hypothetical protein
VVNLKHTFFLNFILKKNLEKNRKNAKISKKDLLMIWSVVHFVITPGYFGAFILPLRPHKTRNQYPP